MPAEKHAFSLTCTIQIQVTGAKATEHGIAAGKTIIYPGHAMTAYADRVKLWVKVYSLEVTD